MDMFSNKEEIIIDHHIDGGPATTEGVTPEKLTFWYISVPSGIFLGEMHRHMSHEQDKKTPNFIATAWSFWPKGCSQSGRQS